MYARRKIILNHLFELYKRFSVYGHIVISGNAMKRGSNKGTLV